MRRSLAAVLAADIVGYSRMMSADAEATLATLQRLKAEVLNPAIAARRGRIVKSMGDGWIVVFEAVTDAIECAMYMQDRLKIDGAVQMRTGVHIGDIAEADEDVFGDGVNIAARLQESAEPGTLALSDAVYSLLDGTLRPSFDDAGERRFKNIPRPLRVWVRGGALAGQASDLQAGGFPHLVIRPVATTDARAEVQDLANALTGDLVFLLDAYRGYTARVSEAPVAQDYELKTSLRASGMRLRLEAQLIAPDGASIAAHKLDGDLNDVFDWQDQAAGEVAGHILHAILHHEVNRIATLAEDNRTASDWAFLAVSQDLRDLGLDGHLAALKHFDKALSMDPENSFLYAQALAVLTSATGLGFAKMLGPFADRADTWAAQLDRLEQPHSPARILLIWSQIVGDKSDTEKIRQEVQRLTRQMPFDPELLFWAGWVYLYLGEPVAALECIARINAKALPLHFEAPFFCQVGFAHLQQGHFEKALDPLQKSYAIAPEFTANIAFLAAVYAHLGRLDEARDMVAKMYRILPTWTISADVETAGFVLTPEMHHYLEGLRKAGVPE